MQFGHNAESKRGCHYKYLQSLSRRKVEKSLERESTKEKLVGFHHFTVTLKSFFLRQVEPGGPGWLGEGVEVWCGGREAERSSEYQPLPAVTGGRNSGTESSADSHPFQELPPYVLITRLPGQRQQDCHGGAGEIAAPKLQIFSPRCTTCVLVVSLVLFLVFYQRCLRWTVTWERRCAR